MLLQSASCVVRGRSLRNFSPASRAWRPAAPAFCSAGALFHQRAKTKRHDLRQYLFAGWLYSLFFGANLIGQKFENDDELAVSWGDAMTVDRATVSEDDKPEKCRGQVCCRGRSLQEAECGEAEDRRDHSPDLDRGGDQRSAAVCLVIVGICAETGLALLRGQRILRCGVFYEQRHQGPRLRIVGVGAGPTRLRI
jgi:hypothetical protein